MRGLRAERLKALLQTEIASFMLQLRQDLEMHELIGVDEVMLTPDLKIATVWVSFSPKPDSKIMEKLTRRVIGSLPAMKSWLAKRLELRQIPKFVLKIADPEKEYKLDQIFDSLDEK